jgi:hypothetical protein
VASSSSLRNLPDPTAAARGNKRTGGVIGPSGVFPFLDYFKKVYGRAEPLPKWSDADVDEFIASDPVYGPQVGAPLLSPFLLASPIL